MCCPCGCHNVQQRFALSRVGSWMKLMSMDMRGLHTQSNMTTVMFSSIVASNTVMQPLEREVPHLTEENVAW